MGRAVLIGILAAGGGSRSSITLARAPAGSAPLGPAAQARPAQQLEPPAAGPDVADGSAAVLSLAGSAGLAEAHASVTFDEMTRAAADEAGEVEADGEESPEDEPPPSGLPLPAGVTPVTGAHAALSAPAAFNDSPSPAPEAAFIAVEDDNSVVPPDTHGAAGPRHLMVTLNNRVRIQDRTGATLSTLSLNQFWQRVNGGSGTFDPKVSYDPYGRRWIVVACDDNRSAASAVLVGVSQSDDPTGAWNLYRLPADPSGRAWADFPSLGFNGKWIVIQANLFNLYDPSYGYAAFWALDKADLYAGGSGRYTSFAVSGIGGTVVPASTYEPGAADLYLLQNWNGNYAGLGFLRLWKLSGAVGAEALESVGFVAAAEPWADYGSGGAELAPQLGSARKIVVDDSRLSSLVFRNGTLWAAQMALLPAEAPTRSAVQWWQLTTGGAVLQRGRVDDPSGGLFYAYPSLAVNRDDTVLLGYSRFSAGEYAGAYYALRVADDPPGTLRGEQRLKAGEGPYAKTFGGTNRWGDYSATTVDPLDDLGFWTIQEYAARPTLWWDQWGTWWGRVLPPDLLPSLSPLGEQYLDNSRPAQLSIVVGNAGRPLSQLAVSAASSNEAVLPSGQMLVTGQGAERTLALDPLPGVSGQAEVTLTASDGSLSASQHFTVHLGRLADLSITNSDGSTLALPGQVLTYTLAIRNLGPGDVQGAAVTDLLPAGLAQPAWACVTSGGPVCAAGGARDLQASAVDLASGAALTYTVSGILAGPAGALVTNTASVTAPPEWLDPPGNNSATDSTLVGYAVYLPLMETR